MHRLPIARENEGEQATATDRALSASARAAVRRMTMLPAEDIVHLRIRKDEDEPASPRYASSSSSSRSSSNI